MIAGLFESEPSSGGSDGGADEGGTAEPPPPAPGRSPEGGGATCVVPREAASAGERETVVRLPSSATSVATAPEGVVSVMTGTPDQQAIKGMAPRPEAKTYGAGWSLSKSRKRNIPEILLFLCD